MLEFLLAFAVFFFFLRKLASLDLHSESVFLSCICFLDLSNVGVILRLLLAGERLPSNEYSSCLCLFRLPSVNGRRCFRLEEFFPSLRLVPLVKFELREAKSLFRKALFSLDLDLFCFAFFKDFLRSSCLPELFSFDLLLFSEEDEELEEELEEDDLELS